MRHTRTVSLAVALLIAFLAEGQTLRIGTDFTAIPTLSDSDFGTVRTVIDLTAPATATGIVTSAHVYWSAANCANAVKIKFFRPSASLAMVAERGPFTVTARDFAVTLSPPVAVMKGDLIGVTRLTDCGVPMKFSDQNGEYAYFSSDFKGPVDGGYNYTYGSRLALAGTGIETEDILRGVVPVVGSVAGSGGSNFKTSLQLFHAAGSSTSITGKLVFHPSGRSGTAADPSVTYTLGPGQVVTYSDVAATFGRSGVGSLDLLATQSSPKPLVVTRVYNDAGNAGTSGLIEDLVDVDDDRVLNAGDTGFLVTPVEPSRTRFNVGVRTLLAGATVSIVLRDAFGGVVRTLTRTYQSNWFEQVDAATFLGGTPINGSQSIAITVTNGSAIVYGSTTDNTTNDPAIQFARAIPQT